MIFPLQFRHRRKDVRVDAAGQLVENVVLLAAHQDRRQRLTDAVEAGVADDFANRIAHLMFVQQPERRSQTIAIHKLDNRDQFLKTVFQRRTGKDNGVGSGDLLDAAGGARTPVFDALGFIEDDKVGRPGVDKVEVGVYGVVVENFEKSVLRKLEGAVLPQSTDDMGATAGKALDLALPLVLERRGADDEDSLDAEQLGHDFGGGEGLNGFAQAHLVANQTTAGPRGEQGAFALVVVERDAQEVLEGGALRPTRKRFRHAIAPALGVAHLRHERQHVVAAAQIVIETAGFGQKFFKRRNRLRQKQPIRSEIPRGQMDQLRRTVLAGPETHLALVAVLKEDLAIRRLKPGFESNRPAPLPLQGGQHKLDVFTSAKSVCGEIGTGAMVVAETRAADADAVGVAALWIDDLELGEDGLIADVLEAIVLFTAELPPQLDLPIFERHAVGLVQPGELGRLAFLGRLPFRPHRHDAGLPRRGMKCGRSMRGSIGRRGLVGMVNGSR